MRRRDVKFIFLAITKDNMSLIGAHRATMPLEVFRKTLLSLSSRFTSVINAGC
jgi:hypothetical protein